MDSFNKLFKQTVQWHWHLMVSAIMGVSYYFFAPFAAA